MGVLAGWLSRLFRGDGAKLLALYHRADVLERRVERGSADKAALLAEIEEARAAIAANDQADATRRLDAVQAALDGAAAAPGAPESPVAPEGPFYRSEGFLRLVSWAVAIAVAAGIVLTGFQTQYIDNGATFGANDLWDHIALLAWGFAAGVAGRAAGAVVGGSTG